MPKFSKETASDVREMGPVTDRREQMNGYTVEFVSFAADADLDGPLQSLPGGACQCPPDGSGLRLHPMNCISLTQRSSSAMQLARGFDGVCGS